MMEFLSRMFSNEIPLITHNDSIVGVISGFKSWVSPAIAMHLFFAACIIGIDSFSSLPSILQDATV